MLIEDKEADPQSILYSEVPLCFHNLHELLHFDFGVVNAHGFSITQLNSSTLMEVMK